MLKSQRLSRLATSMYYWGLYYWLRTGELQVLRLVQLFAGWTLAMNCFLAGQLDNLESKYSIVKPISEPIRYETTSNVMYSISTRVEIKP